MNLPASAILAVAAAHGESQPLDLGGSTAGAHASGGGDIVRTIVGLAIVLAVIFGLRWVLKQFKSGRERKAAGGGLASMATLPLGQNRSLHVVRAGREVLVVGSGEHGVTPVRSYSEAEARALGLLEGDAEPPPLEVAVPPPEEPPPLTMASDGVSPAAGAGPGGAAEIGRRALETLRAWTVRG